MKIKNVIYIVLCICVAFVISGCGKENKKASVTPYPTESVALNSTGVPKTSPSVIQEENPTIAPLENMEIVIYALNSSSLEKEAVTVLVTVEDELTPEIIAEQVVAAMEDEGFFVGINEIIVFDDSVRIDFKSDAVPVTNVGASVEGAIIDILAQSILENLPQYKKIYISIEGNPYQSGHLEFGLDDVYLGR